uniref:Uncharacterized protein n=1 Tax=Ciona intestinalis TaxID=7719 RepID=H2XUT6_CIOIN
TPPVYTSTILETYWLIREQIFSVYPVEEFASPLPHARSEELAGYRPSPVFSADFRPPTSPVREAGKSSRVHFLAGWLGRAKTLAPVCRQRDSALIGLGLAGKATTSQHLVCSSHKRCS